MSDKDTARDERKRIFKNLLDHVSQGFSLESFPDLSSNVVFDYLKNHKEEFIQEDFDKAKRRGQLMWESIGRRQSDGSCIGNSRSWYYNMSNRYGWTDKQNIESSQKGTLTVQVVDYTRARAVDETLEE